MSSQLVRQHWPFLLFGLLFVVSGIVLWITFPPIYEGEVASNLELKIHEDKTLPTSTWQWSHPPMENIMSFYFFNVSNPDEIIYEGAKPAVVEVGPWTVQEKEVKKYMKWSDDGEKVFYENYKTYLARPELCNGCRMDALVTIPNPVGLGAAADIVDPQYAVSSTGRQVVAWSLLLLGEYPFVTQKVGDILFDGYPDPLLSLAHSQFLSLVELLLNNGQTLIPIPIPDMSRMGFFQGYNNTKDEWYWIRTGNGDADRLGEVQSWGDESALPVSWWGDDYSRSIRGSDSGSFSKMHLKKDDVLPMFQSFYCRSFDATYLNETTVHNIPAYTYSVPYEQWDTTANKNFGFRYRNVEQVNYYPEWPACPGRNQSACVSAVDCSRQENLCADCCQGSFVNGTYLLPPGMYPLVCYPGRLEPSPFSVMYSPPHFVYSPPAVADSVYGLSPCLDQHRPFLYSHEPFSGTVVQVVVQVQVSMPVSPSSLVPQLMHLPSSIIPIFWQSARASLTDDTYHLVWLGFVFVPKFIDILKFCSILLGCLLLLLVAFRVFHLSPRMDVCSSECVLSILVIGIIWGATNPLLRLGSAVAAAKRETSPPSKNKILQIASDFWHLFRCWQFSVPFALNQAASVLFNVLVARFPISVVVPTTNAIQLVSTAICGQLLGEKQSHPRIWLGYLLTISGIVLMLTADGL